MAGFLGLFGSKGMNGYVPEAQAVEGAIIVDVRQPSEFARGHVPGALNIPGSSIGDIAKVAPGKDAPLYLYCQSGARSGAAVRALKGMGYTNVVNMGGVARYNGPLVKGVK